MDFFQTSTAVKLKSHLDKYLVADDDRETVRQSRNGASRKAVWFVENNKDVILLKSCHGTYLTASDTSYLLGMTGKRVIQTVRGLTKSEASMEWEPKRDGFQVKMMTRDGKYLRANGGTPPWRNTVTHDVPLAGGTKTWVLWDVQVVGVEESESGGADHLSTMSSFASVLSDDVEDDVVPDSPMSVMSSFSPRLPPLPPRQTGMDLFHNAKSVRLKGHHEKYLIAEEDEQSTTQEKNGSTKSARWTVEFSHDLPNIIRLKSCYNKYLTASNKPFLTGLTGRKVLQTQPNRVDSSVEWEPVREGNLVKLKTRYGQFLRANGGMPPWRNSITHDIPHRTATQDWILWHVDVMEILQSATEKLPPSLSMVVPPEVGHSYSFSSDSGSQLSSGSIRSSTFSRQESCDSPMNVPAKVEGRTIYYHVAGEDGEVDEAIEGFALIFKGNGVVELTQKLKEVTGLDDIIVCQRSPLNEKLYPLRLQLPPNNANMHVVVVPSSSKVARNFA